MPTALTSPLHVPALLYHAPTAPATKPKDKDILLLEFALPYPILRQTSSRVPDTARNTICQRHEYSTTPNTSFLNLNGPKINTLVESTDTFTCRRTLTYLANRTATPRRAGSRMASVAPQQGSANSGASGRQLAREEGAGADNRAQDFKDDIDLDFLSVNRTGGPERGDTRIQRAVDVIAMVDRLVPGGAEAAGGRAQPNQGQTNDLRGAGGQFSK
ncbi:hypothetical protein CSAL01_03178 [Colletotrichum salicis]|uniref:Uncharacterized protein n=1 Tax=Colletotrichum salicis TaxID=1209931 RepID=A0A135STM2_9PEZI|nr:hypothetical protein CSAL01_03178 [Colletotrichum salicis]